MADLKQRANTKSCICSVAYLIRTGINEYQNQNIDKSQILCYFKKHLTIKKKSDQQLG
jgi:hypothetical protein